MKKTLTVAVLLMAVVSAYAQRGRSGRMNTARTENNGAWATLTNGVLRFTYGPKPKEPTQVSCNGCNQKIAFSTNFCPNCGRRNEKDFVVFNALERKKYNNWSDDEIDYSNEDYIDPKPLWIHRKYYKKIRKVIIEPSFKQVQNLTSTAYWFAGVNVHPETRNIESIEGLENLNTANVTDMSNMFAHQNALKTLDVSHFNTAKVTNMSEMFEQCQNLTSLDVSHFNTANVTDMYSMFYDCVKLKELDVSKFNTAKVTNMDGMFDNCRELTGLYLSGWNTTNVEGMRSMFAGVNMTTLDISNFDTRKAQTGGMFWNSGIKTIYVSSLYWSPNDRGYYNNITPYLKNCKAQIIKK